MKIELKHDLDFLEIDTTNQAYSFETYNKELFELLHCSNSEESYFESKPNLICYSGWGNYGDHDEEFITFLFQDLGIWLSWYPETVKQFIEQIDQHI